MDLGGDKVDEEDEGEEDGEDYKEAEGKNKDDADSAVCPCHDSVEISYLHENPLFHEFENHTYTRAETRDYELLLFGNNVGGFHMNDVAEQSSAARVRIH